jgi:hypothetical protein
MRTRLRRSRACSAITTPRVSSESGFSAPPARTDRTPAVMLLPDDVRSWVATTACVAIAYLMTAHGVLAWMGEWQIPLFAGALAGVLADSWAQAALVTLVTLAALESASPPMLAQAGPAGVTATAMSVALGAAASAGVAFALSRAGTRRRAWTLALVALLVACTLAMLWAPLFPAGTPAAHYGPLAATTISEVPQPGHYVNDDALYRRIFYLMHQRIDYYHAFKQAWTGLRQHPAPPNTVVAIRLPTLFWLWSRLPNDAFFVVYVYLGFATLGCVSAAFIAGELAGVRFAPLGSLGLATYAMGSAASVYVTYVDLPAACVSLAGVALFLGSRRTGNRTVLWAAAGVVTAAALTREVLAYLILLAALIALLEPAGKRVRAIVPWLAALGVFWVGYAAHAWAALGYIAPGSRSLSYLKGSPGFALDSLRRFSDYFVSGGAVLPALFLLGALGAIAVARRGDVGFAAFALAALVTPLAFMTRFGNPGIDAAGNQVNYWGNLFVPLALALWPASCLLLPTAQPRRLPAEQSPTNWEIPPTHAG